MIEKCLTSEAPAEQARSPSRMENCDNVEEGSDSEHRSSRGLESEDSRRKDGKSTKVARKGKLRGPNRQTLIGRSKRKINKEMGKASIPAKRKSKEDKVMMQPPVSVMFGENTKDGELSRMLQAEEKRLGGMTSYRVRVAESAGMALSRLLPSTNPWGPGDCGRQDCNI